jgi:hypothetical protein
MTAFRIQELESLGFEWVVCVATFKAVTTFKDSLNELAIYRKIHGHCNVPHNYSENPQLGLGRNLKEQLQVAPRRKDIVYNAPPYPGIGKPVGMEAFHQPQARDTKEIKPRRGRDECSREGRLRA